MLRRRLLENLAKGSKFIEQIMVVGDGEKMPCALVQPDYAFAKLWAERKHLKRGKFQKKWRILLN